MMNSHNDRPAFLRLLAATVQADRNPPGLEGSYAFGVAGPNKSWWLQVLVTPHQAIARWSEDYPKSDHVVVMGETEACCLMEGQRFPPDPLFDTTSDFAPIDRLLTRYWAGSSMLELLR